VTCTGGSSDRTPGHLDFWGSGQGPTLVGVNSGYLDGIGKRDAARQLALLAASHVITRGTALGLLGARRHEEEGQTLQGHHLAGRSDQHPAPPPPPSPPQ